MQSFYIVKVAAVNSDLFILVSGKNLNKRDITAWVTTTVYAQASVYCQIQDADGQCGHNY